ncbi:SpaA isopeptide-forming pilin-related protein [Bacillus manliponensis]|uniref:SpaA isopeptide-forming pilin-related protein n=1 Tax=Bacillus manliponensis TaxID=574376 RepID=UPI00068F7DD0|nr:SpaA isopeptide-forming pilin-related protein [Bacillus manliponensis]
MKKTFNVCLIAFLIVSQLLNFPYHQVMAETSNLHTLFDSIEMKDSNHISIDAASNPNTKIQPGSTVQLEYAWSLKENHTLTNGDSLSLKIPSELQIQQDIQGSLIGNELEIGQYFVTASDNTLKLTFNEQAKEGNGKITFAAIFNPAADNKEETIQITFPLGAKSRFITVPVERMEEEITTRQNQEQPSEQDETLENAEELTQEHAVTQNGVEETNAETTESEDGPKQITENILTSVKMTDKNGKPFDDKENRPTTSDITKIEFTWDLPNDLGAKSGDYYTFKLPEHFAIYNDVEGDLIDGSGESVGTYTIKRDGTVTMTFNDYIETHSYISGALQVQTEFNKQKIKGSTTQEIHFPVTEEGITIPVEFKPNVKNPMDKSGLPNKKFNANEINWTVNINKTKDTLMNAVMKDAIPKGLSLDTNSIEVYYLNVDIDGNTTLGEKVNSSAYTISSPSESNLAIAFNDTINQAYQIRYKTKITDDSKTNFTNKATLSSDNQKDTETSATVTASHGTHLNKTSKYDPTDQTITWTITYNGDEKTIKQQDALLKDLFDNSHELVEGSVVVNKAAYDDSGKLVTGEIVNNYTVTSQKNDKENGFNLQFNEDIHNAYVITYKTKPIGNVTTDNKIKNTVTTGGGSSSSNTTNTTQQNVIKSNTSVNYKDKTTSWKIEVNKNNYEMNNAVITDTFDHGGLTLHKDTFTITNRTAGKPLVEGEDYTLEVTKDGFKVTLTKSYASKMKDTLEITYTTTFDYPTIQDKYTSFKNTAHVSWKNENGKDESSTSSKDLNPDQFTKANGFKYGIYNAKTKEITWYIGLNYNNVTIDDPYITDILKGNQKFVPGSIEVRHMLLTGSPDGVSLGGLVDSSEYIMETPTESNKNTLKIHFKNRIDSPYYISFKTTVENEFITKEYKNTAELKDGTKNVSSVTGSTTITHGGEFVSKSAKQDGNYINWTININRSQSTLENAKIIDNPTDNQILVADSFHLYGTSVDANGNITKDPNKKLEQGKDYTLQINTDNETGKQTFELTFLNRIDEAYVLEYKTLIYADNGEKVSNKVKLSGSKITNQDVETSEEIIVKTSSGSGTGGSKRGHFEIKKVDADKQTVLADAEFTLYDKAGKNVIRTVSTKENGIAEFKNLRYGEYLLKETKAPKGYVISDELEKGILIKLDSKTDGKEYETFKNDKFVGEAILTKIGAETGEHLQGAIFSLLDENKKPVKGYERLDATDEKGKVHIKNLKPGTYYLKEIKAPTHYELSNELIDFNIKEKQTTVVSRTATNSLKKGSVILKKVGEDDKETGLKDATFDLLDKDKQVISEHKGKKTLEDGTLRIDNLTPGVYYLVEKSAPEHYQVNPKPIQFEIVRGQETPLELEPFVNELSKIGSAQLTKTGEGHSGGLPGAVFKLQKQGSKEVIATNLVTDKDGKTPIVKDLKPGKYEFVEIQAPAGYDLNATPIPFEVQKGQTTLIEKTAHNYLSRGSVTLTKVDADTNATLQGAIFKLLDGGGNVVHTDLETDSEGKITVHGLLPGSYQFVETKAPTHYGLDVTPISVTVSAGEIATVTGKNSLMKGGAILTKVDADSKEVLEGAEFKLVDSNNNVVFTDLKTGKDGKITVKDLKPGDYEFIETKAPIHYDINKKPIKVTIEKGQTQFAGVTAENSLTKGGITLTKVDTHSKETLEGAVFNVLDCDGNIVRKDVTTNKDGNLTVSDLKPGDYQFVETKAPTYYDLSTEPIPFTIDKGQEKLAEITVENSLTTGNALLTKVDAESKGVLAGATFTLLNSNGDVIHADLTTDQDGNIFVSNLKPGNYQFVETAAPQGYELDSTPIAFTIDKGQKQTLEVTALNKPIMNEWEDSNDDDPNSTPNEDGSNNNGTNHNTSDTKGVKEDSLTDKTSNGEKLLPQTGHQNSNHFIVAGFMLLLAGAFSLLAMRRKNESN